MGKEDYKRQKVKDKRQKKKDKRQKTKEKRQKTKDKRLDPGDGVRPEKEVIGKRNW